MFAIDIVLSSDRYPLISLSEIREPFQCADAVQVADRWHLMENLSDAILMAVKRRMRSIRAAFGEVLSSPVKSFANGIEADYAAVTAVITSPGSKGQTEGTICQLKLMKRQMYGRADIDLLRARLMPIAA